MPGFGQRLRDQARSLKREVMTLHFALRDPRTPWLAKLVAAIVVAYALSPIDLIPDFIPLLGLLDDLLLVPLGIALVLRLVPAAVLVDARENAAAASERPVSRAAAVVIIAIWIAAATLTGLWTWSALAKG